MVEHLSQTDVLVGYFDLSTHHRKVAESTGDFGECLRILKVIEKMLEDNL